MITKQSNQYGKSRQQAVCESCGQHKDESQRYKDWLRGVNTGETGIWVDIDLIKLKQRHNGEYAPSVITDLTFANSHASGYLTAIKERWFERDQQGKIFQGLANALGVPAYLVAYGEGKVSVLDILDPEAGWTTYDLEEWSNKLNAL